MKPMKLMGAALLALAVAACGGEGSSPPPTGGGGGSTSGGGSGGGSSGGGTPAPSPTYSKFSELTGTQTFRTSCAGVEFVGPQRSAIPAAPFGQGVTLTSNRDAPAFDIQSDGLGLTSAGFTLSFSAADRDTSTDPALEIFAKVNGNGFTERFSSFAPANTSSSRLEYGRFGQIVAQTPNGLANMYCAFGVPTELNDSPSSNIEFAETRFYGSVYVIQNAGAGPTTSYAISNSTSRLTANPTTGEIDVTLEIKGREILNGGGTSSTVTDLGTFTGSTGIDGSTQNFDDVLVDSSNTVAGTFAGWFFGPQGNEFGYAFSLNTRRADSSDLVVGGVVFGKR